jgi:hypothetical protein
MKLDRTLASAVIVAAISLAPLAADAQDRGSGRERGGRSQSAGAPAQRSNDGGRQAAPREAPRQSAPQAGPSSSRSAESRAYSAPQPQARTYNGPTAVPRQQDSRAYNGPSAAPRQQDSRAYNGPSAAPRQQDGRAYAGQAAPRSYNYGSPQAAPRQAAPRQAVPRSNGYNAPNYRPNDRGGYNGNRYSYSRQPERYYYARPYSGRGYVRPYSWTPYRPYYFARPYYSFRSWFNIGFGLSIGYPVPYPWTYLGSYRPRIYGYYDNSYGYGNDYGSGYGYDATTDVSIYGGISFDIQPSDADVWVDDQYVGTVGTFTPYGEPLTLTPGQHKIVVQRDGFRTMEWDVMVEPGQVIPYRGAMERY